VIVIVSGFKEIVAVANFVASVELVAVMVID